MDLSKIKTDEQAQAAEVDGLWTEVSVLGEVCEMKIARLGNRKYERLLDRKLEPHRRKRGRISNEVRDRIMVECVAEAILLDWRGLKNGDEPFDYSYDNAVLLLTQYRDVYDAVLIAANEAERFRLDAIEDDAGN